MASSPGWFEEWFDTPWYDVLYGHRNAEEAAFFLSGLVKKLEVGRGTRFLDVGCGEGRHCQWLASQGYETTGIDLSRKRIAKATKRFGKTARFLVHDMRRPFPGLEADIVLNLFTSFGYFETINEHIDALANMNRALPIGGTLVMDYMNSVSVRKLHDHEETCLVEDTEFRIFRKVEGDRIVKVIRIPSEGIEYQEKVQLFEQGDFARMLKKTGFGIQTFYGDYGFNPFEISSSDRLILLASKLKNV